jgi:hypothetical protein
MVLVAPATPASAYVYGRYQVTNSGRAGCLTSPYNGVPGTWVMAAVCNGNPIQVWQFDRVSTYQGDPVFVIRATHRVSGGVYTDCLDLPYGEVTTGRPLWTQPCRANNPAQQWRQIPRTSTHLGVVVGYNYTSMVAPDSGWVMTYNIPPAPAHLVMAPDRWYYPSMVPPEDALYQIFDQSYVGP